MASAGAGRVACRLDADLAELLGKLKVEYATEPVSGMAGSEYAEQVDAIERWYMHDWTALDAKLRTSIVEGISVFLSLFDQPDVARRVLPSSSGRTTPRPGRPGTTKRCRRSGPCRDFGGGSRRSPT